MGGIVINDLLAGLSVSETAGGGVNKHPLSNCSEGGEKWLVDDRSERRIFR